MAFGETETFLHVEAARPDPLGRVVLTHAGRTLELKMTWAAIAGMQAEWGEDFANSVSDALDRSDVTKLAFILSLCGTLEDEDRPMTMVDAMDLGFPIEPLRSALLVCWEHAWQGGELPQDGEAPGKPNALQTLLGRLSTLPFVQALASKNSGD